MAHAIRPLWGEQRPRRSPRVIILGHDRQVVHQLLEDHQSVLHASAEIIAVDIGFEVDPTHVDVDFAVVLGGDGSMLEAARQFGEHQIPVLGVNLGRLGFLAAVSPEDLPQVWPLVCRGQCRVIDHLMLDCSVVGPAGVRAQRLGLNETAVLSGPPFAMLHVDLYVDGELATTYSCDGLIIATPVGSTAHSLSAGGPILRKDLNAFVISALSPHTLTVRPVVDSAERTYELAVCPPSEGAELVVDGRHLAHLTPQDRVRVVQATARFRMIEPPTQTYYRTLREKLGWGGNIARRQST